MKFDFGSFVTFVTRWLWHLRWSARQIAIALAFLIFYPLLQVVIWTSFLLDEVLFPQFRKQPVRQPVFVIGMFRSGTTLLHRLLAKDKHFVTMMMWEILFAPAVIQRKVIMATAALTGRLVTPLLDKLNAKWRKLNTMHAVSLQYPEEDDYLLLHRWSTLTAGLSAGELELARPYIHFDQQVAKRTEIMEFYKLCVKKHLYSHRGEGATYLAKNPALTPKLLSLYAQFPDAKVVFIVRSPLDVIPSFFSMMKFSWRAVGTQSADSALKNFLWEMAEHWYRYPLQVLAGREPSSYAIVRYDDLIAQPEKVISDVYQRLQLPLSDEFIQVVRSESAQIKKYKTQHYYDLETLGLSEARILEEFSDIFQRFNFPTPRKPKPRQPKQLDASRSTRTTGQSPSVPMPSAESNAGTDCS